MLNSEGRPSVFSRFVACLRRPFRPKPLKSRSVPISPKGIKPYHYPANVVKNQKYNLFTFLPMVLFEQFFPDFRVGYLFTYIAPLAFVLSITISKEAYDDFKRYRRDREANSQKYKKLTLQGFKMVPSYDIKVGDIIHLEKNQKVPADMVFLKTSESNGSAFIRTDQLDGETDWKLRIAVPTTQNLASEYDLFQIGACMHVERPHKDIHTLVGTMTVDSDNTTESLSVENTLWMNTVLASGNAYGLVVYTGAHARACMNTSQPSVKYGLIDIELNRAAKLLFALSLGLAFLMVSLKGFFGPWPVYLARFFILFSYIIPLSLRVNVDLGRLFYAYQIMRDPKSPNIIVRNSSIPEELGRVGYLLCDKTGTLTQNDMELKKIHLGTLSFGADATEDIMHHLQAYYQAVASTEEHPGTLIPDSPHYTRRGRRDLSHRVHDLVLALSLCHNVTPSIEHGQVTFQASSPDEIAIVKWTQALGSTLIYRDRESIHLAESWMAPDRSKTRVRQFTVLDIFPFTSESKRMGIIVQDNTTLEICFYIKGADAVMSPLVVRNDWLDEECDNMAREGLRTLVVARKKLSHPAYEAFRRAYDQAKCSMQDRVTELRRVIAQTLETELELLGLTGVEDRLQEDVKVTLEALRHAGMKIWMLTGDKVETATCIAVSSKLVARNQDIYQVQKLGSRADALEVLTKLNSRSDQPCNLVLDGVSLEWMLSDSSMALGFVRAAVVLPAVICCRCTPTQKAEVAALIKQHTKVRVACIGDGGNDVSMIQVADVGIGLVGKEGRQASLAADFSLTQFSHLRRLLLWHGRNSYKRTAKLSQFVIHRGFVIAVIQAVFSSIFYFTPIALYQGYLAVGYCTIYTNFPVFSLVLDVDVDDSIVMMFPELYKELTKGRSLSARTFFTWVLVSLYQGGIIMLMAIWLFESDFIHIVAITFTALVFNELLMVALQINTWHILMILAELLSLLLYILSVRIFKTEFDPSFTQSLPFLWKVSTITFVSFVPLFVINLLKRFINPPNYTKLS